MGDLRLDRGGCLFGDRVQRLQRIIVLDSRARVGARAKSRWESMNLDFSLI